MVLSQQAKNSVNYSRYSFDIVIPENNRRTLIKECGDVFLYVRFKTKGKSEYRLGLDNIKAQTVKQCHVCRIEKRMCGMPKWYAMPVKILF